MSPKKKYVAVYERDPGADAWNVRINGVEGCQTYGRSLRQAQTRIREALAVWLDREPEDLTIEDRLPASVANVATRVARARHAADAAGEKAQKQTSDAVRQLTDLGLSRRDAADVLGLSHQRIQQLVESN